MTGNRWWHLLFGATVAVLAGIAGVNLAGGDGRDATALAALGALACAYVAVGRRGFTSRSWAFGFVAILIACSGVAVAADPNMALIQCIAMPLLWIQLDRTRDAIVGNVVLTAVIAAAMAWALALDGEDLAQVALIESISLVGSLCLGLWITRISELSADRARLVGELQAAEQQVSALSREAGVTSERERLAREIHDTIAQSLTGVVLLGQRAQRELSDRDDDRVAETLVLLEETARQTLVETRSLVASSAPVDLAAGIIPALERLGRRFERETGVAVSVSTALDGVGRQAAGRDLEVVVLRCAQEALANVRKHSHASAAAIDLERRGSDLVLTVTDDGCGFEPDKLSDGFGLAGLRARIGLVAGRLEVASAPGGGTVLVASVPVPVPVPASVSATGPEAVVAIAPLRGSR